MRTNLCLIGFSLFAAAASLAACSGGGGGSGALPPSVGAFSSNPPGTGSGAGGGGTTSGSPSPGSLGSPSPATTATPGATSPPGSGASGTPGPSASPTALPTGYFVQGTVQNIASGVPISGATVIVAPRVYGGATPPPSVSGAETTTAADGTFTLTGVAPGSNYVEVFENGYASIHKPLAITSFDNQLGVLHLTAITADESAWLQRVNADRAQYGASTIVIDEFLQEGAQHWVDYMADNGYYNATCAQTSDPACETALQLEQADGGQYTSTGQNISAQGAGSSWTDAENQFMAESANCSQPVTYAGCKNQTNAADFLNIIDPNFIWVGLAEHKNGSTYNPTLGPSLDYYTQEFATPYTVQ